jgi:hypothetical protein
MGPRIGLDDVEERIFLTLPVLEPRPLCSPDHGQLPYRLRYPGSFKHECNVLKRFHGNTKPMLNNEAVGKNDSCFL